MGNGRTFATKTTNESQTFFSPVLFTADLYFGENHGKFDNDDVSKMAEAGGIDDVGW